MYRIFFIIYFLVININNVESGEVNIQFKINNEIVTNVDIEREYRYLTALNTSLQSLEKKKAYQIARNSMIKEIIKKNELKKYYKLDQKPEYMKEMVINFYKSLGIKSENKIKK